VGVCLKWMRQQQAGRGAPDHILSACHIKSHTQGAQQLAVQNVDVFALCPLHVNIFFVKPNTPAPALPPPPHTHTQVSIKPFQLVNMAITVGMALVTFALTLWKVRRQEGPGGRGLHIVCIVFVRMLCWVQAEVCPALYLFALHPLPPALTPTLPTTTGRLGTEARQDRRCAQLQPRAPPHHHVGFSPDNAHCRLPTHTHPPHTRRVRR
jgi:hypothetical protein